MPKPYWLKQLTTNQVEELKRIRQSNTFQSTAQMTAAEIDEIRERCASSFFGFVKEAWPHVPGLANVEYIEAWHIRFVGYHLAAISYGWTLEMNLPNRLLINIPPAMMKSLLVSVFWPAFEWTMNPAFQYIVTSYREDNCKRDTARMCGLVMSDWYQMLWGEDRKEPDGTITRGVKMVATGETKISNTAGGWREGIPFGSLTGNRADRVIIDDPHSIDTAESDAQRNKTTMRFRESVPSRLNDPIKSAIVVVMQRLHVNDISGVIEELKLPYVKVVLPMEFEKARRCVTPFGAMDERQQEGELLFPERFPKEVVERDKRSLGEIAVAGQFQQRPIPRGGLMFKANWFEATVTEVPANCRYVRHWDLAALKPHAGSSYGQAWTAGVKLGRAPNGVYYIVHVDRLQGDGNAVRRRIKLIAHHIDGRNVIISLPQDPGQAGLVQKQDLISMLDGYVVRAQRETGDKITRAEPLAAQAGAGNLKIVKTGDPARDSWIEPFLAEILAFPRSQVKDQVDALSAAYVTLNRCASQEAQWRGSPDLDVARDSDYGSASYNDPLESGHPDRSNPDRLRYGSPNNYLDGIRMGHPDRYDEPPDYGSGGDPDALW